jgi:hypothetical protein
MSDSKAVATRKGSTAVAAFTGGNNPFTNFGNEAGSFGAFMKFSGNTGEFSYGSDNEPLEVGTQLAVNMMQMERGWVCWIGGKPYETIMNKLMDEVPMLAEEDLPDHTSKYQNEKDDGWVRQTSVPMSMLDDGSELEFKTSSKSGIMALQKLSKEFGTKCHLHVDDNGEAMMPIVEIGSVSFPIRNGKEIKHAPTFKIVDWISLSELMSVTDSAAAAAAEKDENEGLPEFDPDTGELMEEGEVIEAEADESMAEPADDVEPEAEPAPEAEAEAEAEDDEADELAELEAKMKALKAKKAAEKAAAAKAGGTKSLKDNGRAAGGKKY